MDDVKVTEVFHKMIQVGNKRYIAQYFAIEKHKYLCKAEEIDTGQKINWTEIHSNDPSFAFGEHIKYMYK